MDRSKDHKFHRNRFGHLLENGIPATEGGSVTFDDPHLELVSDVGTRDLPVDWVQSCGILASRHVFLSGITWETLRKQGLVYGRKITLYGQDYLLRCPQVANHGEWEQFVAATSQDIEWRGDSSFFGQEFIPGDGVFQMDRCSVVTHGGQIVNARDVDKADDAIGFRMILEPIDPEPVLARGDIARRVSAYCGEFRLDGSLVDFSDYDLVIHLWRNKLMPDDFGPGVIQDGEVCCIDRQLIQHLSLGPV